MATDGFTTCLWFDGNAEEAAQHYISIFKNSRLGRIAHYTGGEPGGAAGSVMTVEFEANGQRFVGLNGGPQFTFSEAISFQVHCADQDEVDYYWSRLSEGGEEGPCGWVKDKFGVSWQVVPTVFLDMVTGSDPQKAKRATDVMMKMGKLDIAALQAAYDGA
ncbi:VOC family protein [Streptomyces violaceusniger]|uniref:3-demethylubiquinone-9 3-methyltransferase n=1 Tax=Streptomyces violaceusniger (strain Tu 4113) TaxID=653045 RepID=G2P3U7_STRV4|nr:VOC family protein [Streptomyces violaceusniger]AEM84656.1 3-demethylubiquinone-9 3-methyltransferase [Streptomyces violaceusniger Tu 4113]